MIIIIIIISILFVLSNSKLNFIKKFLNKIKNIQNILILLFSLISFFTINIKKYNSYFKKNSIDNSINNNSTIIKKRNVTGNQKKYIASKQKWKCNNCKNILDHTYEIDHILPIYKGGTNTNDNLQALCRNCHGLKTFNDLN